MQFCLTPGCGQLVSSGRCALHRRQTRQVSARAHSWYVSARWLRLRAAVLVDEPFCRTCRQQGRKVIATDVDHIRPHRGDPVLFWDPRNCQPLCRRCHSRKTMSGQ
jgi:5-methylcytosine-specific restriction enzyme A